MRIIPDQTDFHIHGGIERDRPLDEIIRFHRDDGRKVLGVLDHAELYLPEPPHWAADGVAHATRALPVRPDLSSLLGQRLGGPAVFFEEARNLAGDVVFIGLEVGGALLEQRLVPSSWLDGTDFVGVCTTQPPSGRAWGAHLALLLDLARGLIGGRSIGLVLHHPFRWRLCDLVTGTDPLPEAIGFTAEDAQVAASALAGTGALAEANYSDFFTGRMHKHTTIPDRAEEAVLRAREAYIRLRDAGARFSVGSDFHETPAVRGSYRAAMMLDRLGLSEEDLALPCEPQAKWVSM